MNFLAYSNLNNINVIPPKEFGELTREVFRVLSDNISRSLGPLGSSAIIFDGAISESTKDGFSILKKYRFSNLYKTMILQLIKRPCTKMNNTVGDGTTTAIVLANAIYEIYQEKKNSIDELYRLPRQFQRAWDHVVLSMIERVGELKTPLNTEGEDVYNIAYVTSNGNEVVSQSVADVYKKNPTAYIHIKDSGTNKSYLKAVTGFEFPANVIDGAYTRSDTNSVEFEEPAVMIFDHTINVSNFESILVALNNLAKMAHRALVVIAPSFEKTLCDTDLRGYCALESEKPGGPNLIPCQYRTVDLAPNQLHDLAAVLDCNVITQDIEDMIKKVTPSNPDEVWEGNEDSTSKFFKCIGRCKKVSTSCENGSIFEVSEMCDGHKRALVTARNKLDEMLANSLEEEQNISLKCVEARQRVSRLEMNNFIYYVGADSELQKQILRDSIDDVVKCLRSAAKHGVVPGCQITLYRAAKEISGDVDYTKLERLIASIIMEACAKVYKKVLSGPNSDVENPYLTLKRLYDVSGVKVPEDIKSSGKEDDFWRLMLENFLENVVRSSVESGTVYDIETMSYSSLITTSAETDTMVLSSASELVKILIAGNQCVYVDRNLNVEHEEEVQVFGD